MALERNESCFQVHLGFLLVLAARSLLSAGDFSPLEPLRLGQGAGWPSGFHLLLGVYDTVRTDVCGESPCAVPQGLRSKICPGGPSSPCFTGKETEARGGWIEVTQRGLQERGLSWARLLQSPMPGDGGVGKLCPWLSAVGSVVDTLALVPWGWMQRLLTFRVLSGYQPCV